MNENDLFKQVAREIIKSMAETRLRSKEVSKEFAGAANKGDIEKNIDKIVDEISNRLIKNLDKEGKKDLTKKEFESIVKKTVDGYFSETNESKSDSK